MIRIKLTAIRTPRIPRPRRGHLAWSGVGRYCNYFSRTWRRSGLETGSFGTLKVLTGNAAAIGRNLGADVGSSAMAQPFHSTADQLMKILSFVITPLVDSPRSPQSQANPYHRIHSLASPPPTAGMQEVEQCRSSCRGATPAYPLGALPWIVRTHCTWMCRCREAHGRDCSYDPVAFPPSMAVGCARAAIAQTTNLHQPNTSPDYPFAPLILLSARCLDSQANVHTRARDECAAEMSEAWDRIHRLSLEFADKAIPKGVEIGRLAVRL